MTCNHCAKSSSEAAKAVGAPEVEATWAENRDHPRYCPTCHGFLRADGGCTRCGSGVKFMKKFCQLYADKTGCDDSTATQAAFVAATLMADLVGRRDIGDYFAGRAAETEETVGFRGFERNDPPVNTGYDDPNNWGWF